MTSIKVIVHRININQKSAVISLSENGVAYLNKNNIGVELDSDGAAIDLNWFYKFIKYVVHRYRLVNLEINEEDLI
jgi:hypothetical protein